ncbi:MAG TPA: hypothetical protein VKA65_06465 [Acidimicrobiales bacterium]|nr:hypothetical protein [Acidimicrobiales bacterium]
MATTGPSHRPAAPGRPPERAQAVWQSAVRLAGAGGDHQAAVLALLRDADFDPSTLRHALTLGRTRLRLRPHDARLCGGRDLLAHATDWLGARDADGEVGAARSDGTGRAPGAVPVVHRVRSGGPTG